MHNSKIEWCDHTVNFWWGCNKVSLGCANCYAAEMDKRFHGGKHWGTGTYLPRLEKAREECLRIERRAAKDGKPVKVFVNSMSDWLDPDVPFEWLAWLLDTIRMCPHVTFLLLSKRIELWHRRVYGAYTPDVTGDNLPLLQWMGDWLCAWEESRGYSLPSHHRGKKPPSNVWIGTTVELQEMADKRIPELLKIPARVRFISCEPLLGPVEIIHELKGETSTTHDGWPEKSRVIHWVICGGESGPKARPMHPDWPRALRDQCKADGVPFFFKQWGEWLPAKAVLSDEPYQNYFESASTGRGLMCRSTHKATRVHRFESVSGFYRNGEVAAFKVGKNAAGHLLDGVEHHEFPLLGSEASHD